jgi:YD repeat-containing protein
MTLSSDKYQYDADNNRVKDTSAAGTTAYGYDHLNRLTSETAGNGQVTKYTYDANGNRTSVTRPSGVTKYTYDKANRMLTAGSIALSYDHNGNLADDGTHMFAYDAFDRLTSITGYNISYAYDGGGRRIAQTTPAGTYRYVNNPLNGQVLLEDGPDGKFVNLYAGGRPISETSSSLQLYYHFDSIGNVVAVTDSTGKDVQNYMYDAFGIEISSDALGDKNKRRALRGYTDPITDFVYLGGSRYYNPAWGRTFSGTTVGGYPDSDVYQEDNPLR